MSRLILLFVICFVLLCIQSCATTSKSIKRDDPLIGKIFNTQTRQPIDFDTLIEKIKNYDVIYLSEKHDNPDHHRIQQDIITSLIDKGLRLTIGFEFFAMNNTPDLLNFVESGEKNHDKKTEYTIENNLRRKLGWDTQSDDMWTYYFDLLNLAKKADLSVSGLDLSNSIIKRITRKGIANITPVEQEFIFSTHLSDPAYKSYMFSIFKAVHCGMGHERMQSRLYDTWLARNDKIALSISQLHKHHKGPVVVIIGGGHTEYGLGVIDRVTAVDNTITQLNLSLQEISVTPSDLPGYLSLLDLEGFKKIPPSDYIWFTQRVSYRDPCEEFQHALKKIKNTTDE